MGATVKKLAGIQARDAEWLVDAKTLSGGEARGVRLPFACPEILAPHNLSAALRLGVFWSLDVCPSSRQPVYRWAVLDSN